MLAQVDEMSSINLNNEERALPNEIIDRMQQNSREYTCMFFIIAYRNMFISCLTVISKGLPFLFFNIKRVIYFVLF